jgi:hypothetical protein
VLEHPAQPGLAYHLAGEIGLPRRIVTDQRQVPRRLVRAFAVVVPSGMLKADGSSVAAHGSGGFGCDDQAKADAMLISEMVLRASRLFPPPTGPDGSRPEVWPPAV